MNPITILQVGNQRHPWCTEVHLAASLELLGHKVVRWQEEPRMDWAPVVERVEQTGAQLLLWTRTWDTDKRSCDAAMARLKDMGIPTVSYHLDRYWGLDREYLVHSEPFFQATQILFSPDAAEDRWAEAGVNHVWMPPGVFGPECEPVKPDPRLFPEPVVFVGSHPYPHPAWEPYRTAAIKALTEHFGPRFKVWPVNRRPLRNNHLTCLYQTAQVVVGDSCVPPGPDGQRPSKYWCVDAETEILTDGGWKRYDSVTTADQVYTMNPETGLGEWQQIEAVSVHPSERRTMWAMEGERHSSLTTLDHRWLVERHTNRRVEWGTAGPCPECGRVSKAADPRWGTAVHRAHMHGVNAGPPVREVGYRRQFRQSRELISGDRIPIAAPCANLPMVPKYSDAYVELVAWCWTEGSRQKDRYSAISQSHKVNGPYVARIRAALTALAGPGHASLAGSTAAHALRQPPAWVERERGKRPDMTVFGLNATLGRLLWEAAPRGVVTPEFVMALTAAQLRLFVETSIDADGCRVSSMRGPCHGPYVAVKIAQREARRLDAFEMACALLGQATNRQHTGDNMWQVHVKRRAFTAPLRKGQSVTAGEVEHEGIVWCPTTANGTWLARRRGTMYFTGNSDRVPETIGRGGFLVHPDIDFGGRERELPMYVGGHHLATYPLGDFDAMVETVEYYLDNPEEREVIRKRGQAQVLERDTYQHRMARMLEVVQERLGIPEPRPKAPSPPAMHYARLVGNQRVQATFRLVDGDSDRTGVDEVWKSDDYHLLEHRAEIRGKTVVDIGANVGAFSVLAAKLGAKAVHAYEPHPDNIDALRENIATNGVGEQVGLYKVGVRAEAGEVHLSGAAGGAFVAEAAGGHAVSVRGINGVIQNAAPVEFMKIDCEGSEYDIIEGVDSALLDQIHYLAMEWHGPGMPHLTHLDDDGRFLERWGAMVAKLADHGRVETFGHPRNGGLLRWKRYA